MAAHGPLPDIGYLVERLDYQFEALASEFGVGVKSAVKTRAKRKTAGKVKAKTKARTRLKASSKA